jgi:hypothetical protein
MGRAKGKAAMKRARGVMAVIHGELSEGENVRVELLPCRWCGCGCGARHDEGCRECPERVPSSSSARAGA